MRIISGKFKNHLISTDRNNSFRPTMTKVREAIFSMLISIPNFTFINKRVLDLYAGSGILGFESLSRGAVHTTFIDNSISQLAFIQKNAAKLQVNDLIATINQDISAMTMKHNYIPFDLVFVDPPYNTELIEVTLKRIVDSTWVNNSTLIVVEVNKFFFHNILLSFTILKEKKYSDTKIYILQPIQHVSH